MLRRIEPMRERDEVFLSARIQRAIRRRVWFVAAVGFVAGVVVGWFAGTL